MKQTYTGLNIEQNNPKEKSFTSSILISRISSVTFKYTIDRHINHTFGSQLPFPAPDPLPKILIYCHQNQIFTKKKRRQLKQKTFTQNDRE